MTEIIEMFWGCLSCSAQRNRGRFKNCETCGAPRTEKSPEYMPDDIQSAPAVTDGELLRKFRGGADWSCKYCGSSEFRADGSCKQCGSPQGDSLPKEPPPKLDEPFPGPEPTFDDGRWRWTPRRIAVAIGGASLAALGLWGLFHERVYDVTVSSVAWTSRVEIDRFAVHAHESFAEGIAGSAFDRVPMGQRHHHDEKILDHYEAVTYLVREAVGSHQESYSASEACGQTCRAIPRTCTSNKNGSATCTGGGQSCSTKYCSVTRYRTVTDYGMRPHVRQEPRYRYEPRYAEWYGWKNWEWALDHNVDRAGNDTKVTWPPPDQLQLRLGQGEQQREQRSETLHVTFSCEDDRFEYVPPSEQDFAHFPVRSKHRIKKSAVGAVQIIDDQRTR